MANIEFESETLGEILSTKKNLRVPTNQRAYAWQKEHVDDLLKDLNAAITSGAEEYFLGAIIVVASKGSVEVFDGQQRLATTLILIAAIRDFFFNSGDEPTATSIAQESIRSVERRQLEMRPHLRLSADDNQYFEDRVLRAPNERERLSVKPDAKKASHKLIDDAAKLAASHISTITKQLPPKDKAQLLQRWLDFLDEGARVIWVQVADEKTAFRIFETMNDRGLKLSAADLVKNYLYSLGGARKQEVAQKWLSMAAVLESLGKEDGDIVDYIRYFWITTHGPTRVNDLFDHIKNEVNSEATAISWISTLEVRSNDYAAILTPSHDRWSKSHQEVKATIDTLRYLGVSQIRPLLLAAIGIFSEKELKLLFKAAVNWSVRCLISGVPSGTLEGHYSRSAKKVTDRKIHKVTELSTEMAAIIPNDEAFKSAFLNVSVPTASLARYYLRRLQIEKDKSPEPQYTPSDGTGVTLEHILPQKPGAEWSQIPPEEAKAIYNRLGNQALLAGSVNSKIGNVGFAAKKVALAASPFSLTSSVAESSNWDVKMIAKRQAELAELALQAWPLNVK